MDMSSSFEDTQERAQHLPGNHMSMCRFSSRTDPGYVQICGEMQEVLRSLCSEEGEAVALTLGEIYISRTKETSQKILTENCQKVLESLQFPQMFDRQRIINTPYQGTGDWLLQTPEYIAWLKGDHRFLWLKGKAGAGKSTLMKRTLQTLQYHFARDTVTVISYFFDGSGVHLEKSTSGLLRTILFQLFTQSGELLEAFVSTSDDGRFIKGKNLEWRVGELMEVFKIITTLKSWRPTIIVLDALDESPRDEIRSLLFFFEQLFPEDTQRPINKLRFCLSSRHYPSITLSNCPEIWAERHNQRDIEVFTRQKLSHLSRTSDNRRLVESILSQADGVFLWVDLVTSGMLMADDDGESLSRKLKGLAKTPHGLDDLYGQIFSKLSEKERDDTFQVFKWVLFASRRLSPLELCFALHIDALRPITTFASWRESGQVIDKGVQMSRFIRSRSRGLLEIRSVSPETGVSSSPQSDTIQFIHQTVPEFLTRKGFELLQPSVPTRYMTGVCHHQIAATCVTYLSQAQMKLCASMILLRSAARLHTIDFLQWIKPEVTEDDAIKARKALLASYNSLTYSLYSEEDLNPKDRSHISHATEIVFSELPLLKYSISALESHLLLAEESSVSQTYLLNIFIRKGAQSLLLWYGFQAALRLPRKSRLHRVDWSDFLQGIVALGLGSCVRELSRRVSSGELKLPDTCNLGQSLALAISQGSSRIASDVIRIGADPNKRGKDEYSPLDDACIRADIEMVRMLIRAGANVNTRNDFGLSPLHYAAKVGAVNVVKVLVDAKADLEPRIRTGETPLLMAATHDRLDVMKFLINNGANPHARKEQERSASGLAELHRCPAVYAFLNPLKPYLPPGRSKNIDPISRAMTASPSPEKQMETMGAFVLYDVDI